MDTHGERSAHWKPGPAGSWTLGLHMAEQIESVLADPNDSPRRRRENEEWNEFGLAAKKHKRRKKEERGGDKNARASKAMTLIPLLFCGFCAFCGQPCPRFSLSLSVSRRLRGESGFSWDRLPPDARGAPRQILARRGTQTDSRQGGTDDGKNKTGGARPAARERAGDAKRPPDKGLRQI